MTGAVILAAGAGRRLGTVAKALLRVGDATYLQTITEKARAAGVDHVVVVVGAPHDRAVREEARRLSIESVVDNPDPDRGMATSIELGFRAVAQASRAFLWPVDHPFVATTTLGRLLAGIGAHDAARPTFEGRGGHPPLIASTLFSALSACSAEPEGARSVLARHDVINIAVDDRGVVRDVDRPEDLA